MKSILIFKLLLLAFVSFGQNNSSIDIHNFNYKLLEHFVKTGVDEVRKSYNCEPLINDSILYVASKHHADYLVRKKELTHEEEDSLLTRTPQDRVNYFGAKNYWVGENILYTPYNKLVRGKGGLTFDTHTYQGLADAMVSAWVHSPGHFKNIITPEYQLTGLSVSIDTASGRAYACQKFAIADYQYSFAENSTMFPYSDYQTPVLTNSFDGISNQLIPNYKYDFKLSHDDLEECQSCEQLVLNKPFLTVRVENNNFILRVEESDYVKNIMNNRKDGFAIEIVTFDDYMCGNPAYYTKPSRRNEQLKLNGRILMPIYKKDLYKGYKRRKKRKDVKFVPYIFGADSVAFFKRFGQYKLDRHNYQYFEIRLGRVPRDLSGFWMHNLVYIQNGQICHIDYLTSYCGEIMEEYQPAAFIPPSSDGNCVFFPEEKSLDFTIPFEQGKATFTKKDIDPFLVSISKLSYELDSVSIHAYSSVEGDSVTNTNLQLKRAENIAKVLKVNQSPDVPVRISTSTDWEGFYKSVAKHPKWRYLANKSESEVLKELTSIQINEIEPILKPERRGEISMYFTIKPTDENLMYFINRDLKTINHRLDSLANNKQNYTSVLDEFDIFYECVHSLVVQGKVAPTYLANLELPDNYRFHHPLTQKFIMYGYEFNEEFSKNKTWVENHTGDEDFIQNHCSEPSHIVPEYYYILIRNLTEYYQTLDEVDGEKLQSLLTKLGRLQGFYESNPIAELNIDRLNFNLNILLIKHVFAAEPLKYSGNALKSMAQIHEFYVKYGMMDGSKALLLGKTAVAFQQIYPGIEMMTPYATEDSVLAYMLPLGYQHITTEGSLSWYQQLIDLSTTMDINIWCDMFIGNCKIPFQAFDYEPLRDVFCEKCMEHNDFILELFGNESATSSP